MKTEDRSGTIERTVLTAHLTNKHVCARLSHAWPSEGLYRSRYANLLGGWACSHFSRYGDAPGPALEVRFAEFSNTSQDAETVKLVESLLAGLSADWTAAGDINPEYVLDIAQKHIDDVALERALSAAQAARARGDTADARAILSKVSPCLVSGNTWIDPFLDREAMKAAFEEATHPLIKFKGPLGQLFKNVFCRDSLIAFRAIAKAGKSFNLLDIVKKAVQQGNRVAYFCLGDMSQSQVLARLGQRVARKPMEPGDYQIPTGFDSESLTPFPIMKTMHWDTPLTAEEASDAGEEFIRAAGGGPDDVRCRLSVHASRALNVIDLRGMLQQWAVGGWTPDCIAEGSLVLTDRGLVPIESVSYSDRLWDGENWVSHGGAICKGVRNVITHAGITATPDHMVYSENGWRTIESCRSMGLRVAQTGIGGDAVRVGTHYVSDSTSTNIAAEEREEDTDEVRVCAVCGVRKGKVGIDREYQEGELPPVRVWDIINAGPLHRFTVQGRLVHNCVVIDYLDLLGKLPGLETRESLEETWQQMRAITQVFHCCGIVATQSDADGYGKDMLDMGNFNGTRTSNDAVSAMYGISASDAEAAMGLQRIYNIANRNNPDKRVVVTAGSRSVACPMMFSMFLSDVAEDEDKPKPKRKAKKS